MNRRRFLQQVSKGAALLSVSGLLANAKIQSRIHIEYQTNTFGAPIKTLIACCKFWTILFN